MHDAGDNNPEHFFVATQDGELRDCLRKARGAAVIFMSGNGMHLEQPSQLQHHLAEQVYAP